MPQISNPLPGGIIEHPDTQVHNGAGPGAVWTDIDISAVVGSTNPGVALVKWENNTGGVAFVNFRLNGDTDVPIEGVLTGGNIGNGAFGEYLAPFDANGITEWRTTNANNMKLRVMNYWKKG